MYLRPESVVSRHVNETACEGFGERCREGIGGLVSASPADEPRPRGVNNPDAVLMSQCASIPETRPRPTGRRLETVRKLRIDRSKVAETARRAPQPAVQRVQGFRADQAGRE